MSKYSLPEKTPKISEETAHDQIMMLLERYDIDVDQMETEKAETMETTIDKVVGAIMKGQLEVKEEDDGEIIVVQYIMHRSANSTVDKLVYGEMRNRDHIAMESKGNEIKKMSSLLASMCKTNGAKSIIGQLRSSDATAAEYLSLLFL